jgi:hypothetical protein
VTMDKRKEKVENQSVRVRVRARAGKSKSGSDVKLGRYTLSQVSRDDKT